MSDATTCNGARNQDDMIFDILKKSADGAAAARLGRLVLPKRRPIETPNYIATGSRGVVPHITPDNLAKHTSFGATYMALEDCKSIVDILHTISIFTSTGFRNLTTDDYSAAVETLRPDIVIGPADLFHTSSMPPSKKLVRMAERTEEWTDVFLSPKRQERLKERGVSVFAPVLAVPYQIQWEHLSHLADDIVDSLSGLAIYDIDLLPDIEENYKPLVHLPRLSLHIPETPQAILRQVSLGVDILTVPFLNTISDAGVALTFTFPPTDGGIQPLGIDMWQPDHETALEPLMEGCQCYACTTHHRAFVHHLLNAKEMLGWTLLQIHNHQVLTNFFAGIRAALQAGSDKFEEVSEKFVATYEADLPQGTGTRPRARGYHFKGEANPSKINPSTWQNFSDGSSDAGAEVGMIAGEAKVAAQEGAETPLVPDISSLELQEKGFAELAEEKPKST
ncbi:hypothetical protein Brms1b_001779 [Colletotrichum noveboracense]|nr:hypothetical protein Brms1b_001779 [Colletotrichum noveboracense]